MRKIDSDPALEAEASLIGYRVTKTSCGIASDYSCLY